MLLYILLGVAVFSIFLAGLSVAGKPRIDTDSYPEGAIKYGETKKRLRREAQQQ